MALRHVRECLKSNGGMFTTLTSQITPPGNAEEVDMEGNGETASPEIKGDYFWNYKCGEFYVDSLMLLMLNYEKQGHGVGMYIISKLVLPLLHSLGHWNYANSIHRFICRVLTSVTPREGLLMIWERFCNRKGGNGNNIFKDRRLEFRIRKVTFKINYFKIRYMVAFMSQPYLVV